MSRKFFFFPRMADASSLNRGAMMTSVKMSEICAQESRPSCGSR